MGASMMMTPWMGSTILLVEDDLITAMHESRVLEREGFCVLHAESGQRALDLLQAGAAAVRLVLMDLDLGEGMNGHEAAREITARYDLPIVFLSSHEDREIIMRSDRLSGYGYIVKGRGFHTLASQIRVALRLHAAAGRLRALGVPPAEWMNGDRAARPECDEPA